LHPFYERDAWRLNVGLVPAAKEYIEYTNLTPDEMTEHTLVRAGYGTFAEVRAMDTRDYYNAIEYTQIENAIHRHLMKPKD